MFTYKREMKEFPFLVLDFTPVHSTTEFDLISLYIPLFVSCDIRENGILLGELIVSGFFTHELLSFAKNYINRGKVVYSPMK